MREPTRPRVGSRGTRVQANAATRNPRGRCLNGHRGLVAQCPIIAVLSRISPRPSLKSYFRLLSGRSSTRLSEIQASHFHRQMSGYVALALNLRGIGISAVPSLPKAVRRVRLPYPALQLFISKFALRYESVLGATSMPFELKKFGDWLSSSNTCRFCGRSFRVPGKREKCPHCDNEALSSNQRSVVFGMYWIMIWAFLVTVLVIIFGPPPPRQSKQATDPLTRHQSDK